MFNYHTNVGCMRAALLHYRVQTILEQWQIPAVSKYIDAYQIAEAIVFTTILLQEKSDEEIEALYKEM